MFKLSRELCYQNLTWFKFVGIIIFLISISWKCCVALWKRTGKFYRKKKRSLMRNTFELVSPAVISWLLESCDIESCDLLVIQRIEKSAKLCKHYLYKQKFEYVVTWLWLFHDSSIQEYIQSKIYRHLFTHAHIP